MDYTPEHLTKSMEELALWIEDRLKAFETNQQQTSTTTPTVKNLSADYQCFKTLVWKALGMLKEQLELIVRGLDRAETHSRRKVLLLHGVGEDDTEHLPQIVRGILSKQMKLPSVIADGIEVCHRLGIKKDKARPILIRFANMNQRSAVWKAKTALKGSKFSLAEFLTKVRQDVFVAARKHFGMRHCWSSEGTIVILLSDKSRKKVVCMSELQPLLQQYPPNKDAQKSSKKPPSVSATGEDNSDGSIQS